MLQNAFDTPVSVNPLPAQPDPQIALNLADVAHGTNLSAGQPDEFRARLSYLCNQACAHLEQSRIERLYVGSYFCDRFFLSLDQAFFSGISAFCAEYGLGLTLVVPIFGQATLEQGKKRIEELLGPAAVGRLPFDEAVANDPAMALFLGQIKQRRQSCQPSAPLGLVFGRMMAKTPRDPRYAVMEQSAQPYALDQALALRLVEQFGYELAECDPSAPVVDASALGGALPLALHAPHCFMTTGHICQVASINRPFVKKFRPDAPCGQECLAGVQVYEHHSQDDGHPLWFTRLGRTVFFENPDCQLVGQRPERLVWAPADFACERADVGPATEPDLSWWGPWPEERGGLSWE